MTNESDDHESTEHQSDPTERPRDADRESEGICRRDVLQTASAGFAAMAGPLSVAAGAETVTRSRDQSEFYCPDIPRIRIEFGWREQHKLTADDADASDRFGGAVAVDGDTALVGATGEDDANNTESGAAYVFTRSGGQWSQQTKLAPSDLDPNDYFGISVAIDGDLAVVGAARDVHSSSEAWETGLAYVFRRNNGWSEEAKLTSNNVEKRDFFGSSVAIDGDTVIIGAHGDEGPNGDEAGSAYVFRRRGTGNSPWWYEQDILTANNRDEKDRFGSSVAVDGDTALVGVPNDEDPNGNAVGSAYVFKDNLSGRWNRQANLTASDGESGDKFGSSVAIDGDTALVGAHLDDEHPYGDRGSTYVFERSSSGWSQQNNITAPFNNGGDADDQFGSSVAVDGDAALMGAMTDDDPNGNRAGSTFVYERQGGPWGQETKLAASDGQGGDAFGTSVSLADSTALIGAPNNDASTQNAGGAAYVFADTLAIENITVCYVPERPFYQMALLHTEEFNPAERIAVESLRLGRPDTIEAGEGVRPAERRITDVNDDGADDLVVRFPREEDAEEIMLVGETQEGTPLVATGRVQRVEPDTTERTTTERTTTEPEDDPNGAEITVECVDGVETVTMENPNDNTGIQVSLVDVGNYDLDPGERRTLSIEELRQRDTLTVETYAGGQNGPVATESFDLGSLDCGEDGFDPVEVQNECQNGNGVLTLTNPNDEAVKVLLDYDSGGAREVPISPDQSFSDEVADGTTSLSAETLEGGEEVDIQETVEIDCGQGELTEIGIEPGCGGLGDGAILVDNQNDVAVTVTIQGPDDSTQTVDVDPQSAETVTGLANGEHLLRAETSDSGEKVKVGETSVEIDCGGT